MSDSTPGLRRRPFRLIKWLGHDIIEKHPLVRMLHESRAIATAQDAMLPLQERPSYQFRKQRIFTRGRYDGDTSIAEPPPAEPAATEQPPEGGGPADT